METVRLPFLLLPITFAFVYRTNSLLLSIAAIIVLVIIVVIVADSHFLHFYITIDLSLP